MGSLDSRRLQLLSFSVLGGLALLVIVLVATGSVGGDGAFGIARGDASAVDLRSLGEGAAVDGGPASEAAPPPADSVEAFTRDHGEPPGTGFARLRIPSLSVDAPVGEHAVADGVMPEPYGPVDVAYYDMSGYPGLGGLPGEGRNAIFGGHVDLNRTVAYADTHYRGPAVFWAIDRLKAGDIIEVDYAGETLRYAVTWVRELEAANTDWREIWSGDVETDSITLFTCGGEFDFDSREYSHRIVVRAERA